MYSCERCSTQLSCMVVAQRPPASGRLSSRRPYFFSSASPGIGLFHLTRSSVGCIVAGNPSPDMARKRTDSGGSNRGPPDGPFPSLPQSHCKASPGVSLPQLVRGTINNVNLSRAQLGESRFTESFVRACDECSTSLVFATTPRLAASKLIGLFWLS